MSKKTKWESAESFIVHFIWTEQKFVILINIVNKVEILDSARRDVVYIYMYTVVINQNESKQN